MKHKNIDLEEENRHQNQENQALEQLIRYRELEDILQKAKPELSRESILVLEMIEKYLKNMEDKPSDDKYKNAIEEALGILSPETLADYKKYGIEFVLNEGMSYPTARRNKKEGKWEMNLPTKYEYPIQSMILRCIDDILKVDFEGVKKKAKESESQAMIATEEMLARRIEITARVFQANMMLGKNYGWDIKGYELAERYHKDYQDGIREAFAKGLVNQDTLKDDLIERGQTYAKKKLLDSIKPRDDVPAIFPSMQSGAYFEEFTIKERIIGHKNPPVKFRAEEPIMFGTSECDKPIDDLGVSREKEEDSVLNAAIMPDKTIWVLPQHFPDEALSQHSIVAKGKPCVWAGEVTIKGNEVVKIRDQSGHFRTLHFSEEGQKALNDFALQVFKEKGYTVPEEVELVTKHRA